MSVSDELLCSFELLKPLDSSALKSHIKKGRNKRNSILNSPVSIARWILRRVTNGTSACRGVGSELLVYRRIFPCHNAFISRMLNKDTDLTTFVSNQYANTNTTKR